MFDQYNVWKTWGVNLAENRNSPHGIQRAIGVTAIKSMPGAILIVVKLLVVALALTTLLGFISPLFHWAKVLVTVLSTVGTLLSLVAGVMLIHPRSPPYRPLRWQACASHCIQRLQIELTITTRQRKV